MSEQLTGELAPPMTNGEAVFEAPWQGRVFGMAHVLADAGLITWDEFRVQLIDRLAERDPAHPFEYYRHFQEALESLLCAKGLVGVREFEVRISEYRARPHGHDHA